MLPQSYPVPPMQPTQDLLLDLFQTTSPSLGSSLLLGSRQLAKEKYLVYLFGFITTECKWSMYNDTGFKKKKKDKWTPFLSLLAHRSVGEDDLCWFLSPSRGVYWFFRTLLNPPNGSQRRHTGVVVGVISTASKNTLQRMKGIMPIWKYKWKNIKTNLTQVTASSSQPCTQPNLPHVVMQPLLTVAPDVLHLCSCWVPSSDGGSPGRAGATVTLETGWCSKAGLLGWRPSCNQAKWAQLWCNHDISTR